MDKYTPATNEMQYRENMRSKFNLVTFFTGPEKGHFVPDNLSLPTVNLVNERYCQTDLASNYKSTSAAYIPCDLAPSYYPFIPPYQDKYLSLAALYLL